jgi:hypothetical protein
MGSLVLTASIWSNVGNSIEAVTQKRRNESNSNQNCCTPLRKRVQAFYRQRGHCPKKSVILRGKKLIAVVYQQFEYETGFRMDYFVLSGVNHAWTRNCDNGFPLSQLLAVRSRLRVTGPTKGPNAQCAQQSMTWRQADGTCRSATPTPASPLPIMIVSDYDAAMKASQRGSASAAAVFVKK